MRYGIFLALAVVLAVSSMAGAAITGWTAGDDGDGVIVCPQKNNELTSTIVDQETVYQLLMVGDHRVTAADGVVGHIVGSFEAPADPKVRMFNIIDNETTFDWTDYHIDITMSKTFTISGAAVTSPGDWTTVVTAPTQVGSSWIGHIDYYAGTPVAIGETLEFQYTLVFDGSISFCQQMTPTPEPATLALLLVGGVLSMLRRNRR